MPKLLLAAFCAAAAFGAQWKVIGPGGGGAQFLPTISPHDPRTALVRCDMTGAYITHDAGANWRMFNLRGVVQFFAFDPRDAKIIYAHSAGLFRSTDAGRTWRLVYPDPAQVTGIEMPDDHAGERLVTKEGRAARMSAFAVDPRDSKRLWAAISGALHVSADWGRTWKKLADLPDGARKIYVEGAVYAIGGKSVSVWRGGKLSTGASAPENFTDVSAGFSGGRLTVYGIGAGGLYVSEDDGATWRRSTPAPRLTAVATSLNHPRVAYLSYSFGRGAAEPAFGVAKTTDGGRTWEFPWKEGREAAPNILGLWITARFGPGWASNPINLGVSPNDPNLCYGTNYGATMKTTDGGKTWRGVYSKAMPGDTWTTNGIDVTTCYGVHFDPFDARRVFISYTDIGLFGSDDGGQSWASLTRTVPRPWVNTTYWMEFDPEVKGRVWAVASGIHDLPRPKMWRGRALSTYNGGVVVSEDGARTWRVASEALPPTAATHILIDPASPAASRTLYVTGYGRGVFKSADGGKTWALRNEGIAGAEPMAWRLARAKDGVLYLVVARRSEDGGYGNEGDGALYRSTDGATRWERIALPEGVNGPNGIAIDAADPKRLYLAAWGRSSPKGAVDGGIYLSADGGKTWRNVLAKDQHVYDVTADPRDPKTLYACGFESSAWRSVDRGETWQRIRGYNFKWGHRVIPDPRDPKMIYVTTFGGSVWHGPAAGDPQAVEDIVTPQVAFH